MNPKAIILDLEYGQELNILVTDSGRLVQMMSNEASKENAVQYILRTLGLTMSDALLATTIMIWVYFNRAVIRLLWEMR